MAGTSKTKIKAIIFAGGIGTRLWPVSRTNTPKQFEKMVGSKSTLQLTVELLRPEFDWSDIYISTNRTYIKTIRHQLPKIPVRNIIGEPAMRDLAPAVGYALSIIAKKDGNAPVAILWSDHLMGDVNTFKKVLIAGAEYINQNPNKFLFLGHGARFANQNLGWIEIGKQIGEMGIFKLFKFKSFKYRPDLKVAQQFFQKKDRYYWNPGYWVITPNFVLEQYRKFAPKIYSQLQEIISAYGTIKAKKILDKIYPQIEKISFDDAILEKIEPEKATVLTADFAWSDVGTWRALKEAMQKNTAENITKGNTYMSQDCQNCLAYNYDLKNDKLLVGVGLKDMVIVNTGDVLMVCPIEDMKKVKETVSKLKESAKYKKYT